MDIADQILDDHHRQRQAFARLDGIDPTDTLALRLLWGELAHFLESHAAAEEAVLYPHLLHLSDEDGELTKDAIGDHNDIRAAIAATASLEVGTRPWWAAVQRAREANTEHMGEEEDEGLPDFRKHVSLEQRHALNILFEMAKSRPAEENLDRSQKDPHSYVSENRE